MSGSMLRGCLWLQAAKLGKTELVGEAASPRGGVVGITVTPERVALLGKAVTTLNGELAAPMDEE